ncbi:uncharacterized protein LOC135804628 [Sycon ciliatum]|uniref:uncharacterized protein LOC135804628 n=1 Tax=Sycon ciliatum TaxID=27933 RepID=UPI0031F68F0D
MADGTKRTRDRVSLVTADTCDAGLRRDVKPKATLQLLLWLFAIRTCWCVDVSATPEITSCLPRSALCNRNGDMPESVSSTCRPAPVGNVFRSYGCNKPEWGLRVAENCTNLPEQVNNVTEECITTGQGPMINITWQLPEESQWKITGYKINIISDEVYFVCSFLVPAEQGKTWFALRNYDQLLECARHSNPAPADRLIDFKLIEVITLPAPRRLDPQSTVYGGRVGIEDDLNKCFVGSPIIHGVFDPCKIIHLPYNETDSPPIPTAPRTTEAKQSELPTATVRSTSTTPSSNSLGNVSSTVTAVLTSTSKSDGNSFQSAPPHPTATDAAGTAPSADVDGPSQQLALAIVVALGFVVLIMAGVLLLLVRRKHRVEKTSNFVEIVTDYQKNPLKTSPAELVPQQILPLPQYQPPSPQSPVVPPPPITPPPIASHRSHVYISYSRSNPQHRLRVTQLSDWLHENGIAVVADFYYANEVACSPQFFVERGITSSHFVLAVCSEAYADVWATDSAEDSTDWAMLQPPSRLTSWEINLIRVCLGSPANAVAEVIPIVMLSDDDEDLPHVPDLVPLPLLNRRVYGLGNVTTNRDQLDLLQRLHDEI